MAVVCIRAGVTAAGIALKLHKLIKKVSEIDEVSKVIENILKDTPFSQVFIHDDIDKMFKSVLFPSEWVQALDDELSVACCMAVRDLKLYLQKNGAGELTWETVVSILDNCDYIVKDDSSSKRINDVKTFRELKVFKLEDYDMDRKSEIKTWFHGLFNEHNERTAVKNSVIVNGGTLDHLADIASECGAAIRDRETLFFATDKKNYKVMEIGVIRFPQKGNPHIKLFRLIIFAFFTNSRILLGQLDQAGFGVEYKSITFRLNTSAIDMKFAAKAKEKLREMDIFDF